MSNNCSITIKPRYKKTDEPCNCYAKEERGYVTVKLGKNILTLGKL